MYSRLITQGRRKQLICSSVSDADTVKLSCSNTDLLLLSARQFFENHILSRRCNQHLLGLNVFQPICRQTIVTFRESVEFEQRVRSNVYHVIIPVSYISKSLVHILYYHILLNSKIHLFEIGIFLEPEEIMVKIYQRESLIWQKALLESVEWDYLHLIIGISLSYCSQCGVSLKVSPTVQVAIIR